MRDRMERIVHLPFSLGCVSESGIAVAEQSPNRPKNDAKSTPTRIKEDEHEEASEVYEDDEETLSDDNLKSPLSLLSTPKFQRLFKNFKNLSQLFAYKDDQMSEDDLEIGLPTDVKHVTHIGIDGSTTSILSKGWDNLKAPRLPAPPVQLTPPLDLLPSPTQVSPDLRAHRPPAHLTPSSPSMQSEATQELPDPPIDLRPSPLVSAAQSLSPVHLTSPREIPAQSSPTQCEGYLH